MVNNQYSKYDENNKKRRANEIMKNLEDNRGIHDLLENEFGVMYKEIIELEWDCELSEFIEWFIECDEDGCYYANI